MSAADNPKPKCWIKKLYSTTGGDKYYCVIHGCTWDVIAFTPHPTKCRIGEMEAEEAQTGGRG